MAEESRTSGRSDSNQSGHDEGEPTSPASDPEANVRRRLGLVPGDRLAFTVLADGTTVMRAKRRSIRDLAGSVEPGTDRRASIDELSFH